MKVEGTLTGQEIPDRATRIDVRYDAVVRRAGIEIPAQILNLSARGFRLRSHVPLEVGSQVLLVVAKHAPARATVRWANGHEAGGVFAEPVAL